MLSLFSQGQRIGSMADADRLLPEYSRQFRELEVRNDAGELVSRIFPAPPLCPWDPLLTQDEIERRRARGGRPLDEFWKELGVQ